MDTTCAKCVDFVGAFTLESGNVVSAGCTNPLCVSYPEEGPFVRYHSVNAESKACGFFRESLKERTGHPFG